MPAARCPQSNGRDCWERNSGRQSREGRAGQRPVLIGQKKCPSGPRGWASSGGFEGGSRLELRLVIGRATRKRRAGRRWPGACGAGLPVGLRRGGEGESARAIKEESGSLFPRRGHLRPLPGKKPPPSPGSRRLWGLRRVPLPPLLAGLAHQGQCIGVPRGLGRGYGGQGPHPDGKGRAAPPGPGLRGLALSSQGAERGHTHTFSFRAAVSQRRLNVSDGSLYSVDFTHTLIHERSIQGEVGRAEASHPGMCCPPDLSVHNSGGGDGRQEVTKSPRGHWTGVTHQGRNPAPPRLFFSRTTRGGGYQLYRPASHLGRSR